MNRLVLLILLLLPIVNAFSQTNIEELPLGKAIEKAKEKKKYVFMDCYTSWCGPCKMMADKILPLKEVGDYMNEHFVCIKVDMEKGEGVDIARKYQITSYPTFLVLDGNGEVVHRVVGASLTGDEFVKKISAVFDENSVVQLECEYLAGNREMEFLLRYTKALLEASNAERARDIALDIITSMDDAQRCMAPYWFIYEDFRLSPVGSGNLAYLLRHVDQFRQNVGEEKVDQKIASLFSLQIECILGGLDRNVTMEKIEDIERNIQIYKLDKYDYLNGYIDLIKAIMNADTGKVLEACKRVYPQLPDEKIERLYFLPIMSLKDKWTKEQKQELIALTDQLIKQVKMAHVIHTLRAFRTLVLEK